MTLLLRRQQLRHQPLRYQQRGTTLIEVLVTFIIMAIGLLGVAGLQTRLQASEMEAYQRTQALMLVNDMANRMATNRNAAASYVIATTGTGAGVTCPTATATTVQKDLKDWCNALQGAAETSGGSNVGAMVGGRGCVEDLGSNQYLITVAWQGLTPIATPPASVACGAGSYDTANCAGDLCRRTVTTLVNIATL